ncbi:Flavodoxin reductases (ferredoxin-NADPH reductases) family 1 [Klebsiella pneumoniae]|nr:Flavodoxin reductases (ferredoxin-NADPH reductases) family 1 [Klebsiella pneumoniae]
MHLPFTATLTIHFPADARLVIMNAASPVSSRVTRMFAPIARNFDLHVPVEDVHAFNLRVFEEDRLMVETQRPERLPLDLTLEAHIPADRSSIAYRRGLKKMGFGDFFLVWSGGHMRDILPVVVDGLWRQGAKNLAVSLVSAEGQPLPAWTPGAHIDLHLPCGLIRQYSLTGSPAERDRYLLCIARESQSRGGSRYIHDTLRPGQPLMISAPRNHFPLHEGGHVVLLAAGIGITPLLAMAHARAASGASFTLHYYVSRAQEAAFATEIARQLAGGICQIHCSDEGQSPRQRLAQDLGAPDADTRVYFCGPPGFMARVRDTARAVGWGEEQLHSEAFQPPAPTAASAADGTFTITLASTGERWPVPGDKTIAQVLQEHGVAVPLSCEMGICGACLTPVREGTVDHRDTVQSEAEKQAAEQHIALCCSRSLSANLVIDLAG